MKTEMECIVIEEQSKTSDAKDVIIATYRGLLGRDPDKSGMSSYLDLLESNSLSYEDLIRQISTSDEFKTIHGHIHTYGSSGREAMDVFRQFRKYEGPGRAGFVTNFLGCVSNVNHVGLAGHSGLVESFPFPGNFHGAALEWIAVLRSVLDARERFSMIELGAGWAPWAAIGHVAAKQKGLSAHVTAIEGDRGHIDYIHHSFRENSIPDNDADVIHGVIGVEDGIARFPRAAQAGHVYGAAAAFSGEGNDGDAFGTFVRHHSGLIAEIEEVACYSLATVLNGKGTIDLIHCDIQGAEGDLFEHHIDMVTKQVKRVFIGTHSADLDRRLISLFPKHGWVCEGIVAAKTRDDQHGDPMLVADGDQVWRNPAFF